MHTGELFWVKVSWECAAWLPSLLRRKPGKNAKSHFSSGENVTRQHQVVVCRMNLFIKKRKQVKAESKIKWWTLKKEGCCREFREEVRWGRITRWLQMYGWSRIVREMKKVDRGPERLGLQQKKRGDFYRKTSRAWTCKRVEWLRIKMEMY